MKTIRFISLLLMVAFLPACDKSDDNSGAPNENVTVDYSKVKSRVTVDVATGDETKEFYSFDADGKQTGYEKYVNDNRVRLYTNYRYGDKSLKYDWYEGAYTYEVAYVFYNDDYDTLKYISKTITNVINGKKEWTAYEYDSIGRPTWCERHDLHSYNNIIYSYPAFFEYLQIYYESELIYYNFDKFDCLYNGLTMIIEPQSNRYDVESPEWYDCVDSTIGNGQGIIAAILKARLKRKPKSVIRFYDETFTKILSVEYYANGKKEGGFQNEFDLKGNPIKYECRTTDGYTRSHYYTYDVDGRLIGYDYRYGSILIRRSNYVYEGDKLTYDENKYNSDSGEKIFERKVIETY